VNMLGVVLDLLIMGILATWTQLFSAYYTCHHFRKCCSMRKH